MMPEASAELGRRRALLPRTRADAVSSLSMTGETKNPTPVRNWSDESRLSEAYWDHIETQIARYDRALERAGAAHAVVYSGTPRVKFLDDNYYPFQANPHFVGWLPLTAHPRCYIVYTPGETPVLLFFQESDYWHAAPAEPNGFWTSYFDIRVVHDEKSLAAELPDAREKCILLGEIEDEADAFGIERINPATALNILHFARGRKTSYELECMRAASRRAAAGHRAAEAEFRRGASEFDIHLAYLAAVGQTDAALPYGSIVALNEHGAILHYQNKSREAPDEARSFLIDAGATVNGYASDITRSYSGSEGAFADLIERVDALQQAIVGEVRAGVDFKALQALTHSKVADLLIDLALVTGSAEALIANGVTTAFFPHGLGHFLGIQVHDVGGFMADDTGQVIDRPPEHPFLRLTRSLEVDQVLTIEPGFYVIDLLLDDLEGTPGASMLNRAAIDRLRPYGGVRIEDNVRVLEDGCENLTRDAFD